MHTTRLRQATPPLLKTIEPGRDKGAAQVETTISRTAHGASTTCAGRFSKPAGFPGNQTGDPPLFDNEVRAPDL